MSTKYGIQVLSKFINSCLIY